MEARLFIEIANVVFRYKLDYIDTTSFEVYL